MEQSTEAAAYIDTILTEDQQMFVYRWLPVMGSIYCSNELGINVGTIRVFANAVGIPTMNPSYEYTTKEIANKLGMTEIEVNNLFQSAIHKLRNKLKVSNEKSNTRNYR